MTEPKRDLRYMYSHSPVLYSDRMHPLRLRSCLLAVCSLAILLSLRSVKLALDRLKPAIQCAASPLACQSSGAEVAQSLPHRRHIADSTCRTIFNRFAMPDRCERRNAMSNCLKNCRCRRFGDRCPGSIDIVRTQCVNLTVH